MKAIKGVPVFQYYDKSLWNAMVNPLKWNTVKGFLWYQVQTTSFKMLKIHPKIIQLNFDQKKYFQNHIKFNLI